MTAALLEAHGMRTGAYLSPHTRALVGAGPDRRRGDRRRTSSPRAVERVAQAVEAVNRALEEGESVTQFEAATAAAFVALAAAGVESAVIEAGLGGRLDATNVIPSRVTVLTSVGLDHTEWLGETEEEIAAEKLAVLRDHTTLVLGRVSAGVRGAGRADRRRAQRPPGPSPATPSPTCGLARPGRLPAAQLRGRHGGRRGAASGGSTPTGCAAVAAGLELPGRMELVTGDPPLILDAAHNPDGARRSPRRCRRSPASAPVVACLAILADKDAAGIIAALAPRLDARRLHRAPGRAAGASRSSRRPLAGGSATRGARRGGRDGADGGGRRPEAALRRAWRRRVSGRRDARHRFALPAWVRRGRGARA